MESRFYLGILVFLMVDFPAFDDEKWTANVALETFEEVKVVPAYPSDVRIETNVCVSAKDSHF